MDIVQSLNRRTKIVATIGPACESPEMIHRVLQAGVNVARLNFSHGTQAEHATRIERLRMAASDLGRPVCILQDLQGPKIRTGELVEQNVTIRAGQEFVLTTRKMLGSAQEVSVDFPDLPKAVRPGGRILLDDGNLELEVLSVKGQRVTTRVIVGGVLKTHKGVNLPGARVKIPAITEKDVEDLAFGLQQGVDAIALSFVHTASDIHELRSLIQKSAPDSACTPIIAKLERPEALDNLEGIVQAADGVMVARGDLGVEMRPETVPIAQKRIIECANRYGKVVITATQMLDSMINNPRPTRAEASDVANAILDGTDAVMLSGETAAGKYPVETVEMMDAIARQAEEHLKRWGRDCSIDEDLYASDDAFHITRAANEMAHDRNVSAVAVFTQTGRTALLMSKRRPAVPILAFTPQAHVYQRLPMYWGVQPYLVPSVNTIEEMVRVVEKALRECTWVTPGQQVVLICGFPIPAQRQTNLALLHTVGESL